MVKLLGKTSFEFRSGWDQSWAVMIREAVAKAKKDHDADQASEIKYYADQNETYKPTEFVLADSLPDITAKWWQQTVHDDAYQIEADANYEYEYYQDGHPRVEQSDEMSALRDQLEMAKQIYYKGSDSLEGMDAVIGAIESYCASLDRYVHQNSLTRSAEDFIKKVFPAFMTICLVMGAQKAK